MKFKKIIISFILIAAVLFTTSFTLKPATVSAASLDVEVTINYHRYGKDYSSWNVWGWADGGEGKAYDFTADTEYGKKVVLNIKALDDTKKGVGFIIKKGEWVEKDIESDRFIPVNKIVDNKVEIFLVQGDPVIYYDRGDVDLNPKMLGARFSAINKITVNTNVPLTADNKDFKVYCGDDEVSGIKIAGTVGKTTATITLPASADIKKQYEVRSETFGKKVITLEGIFATPEFEAEFAYNGNDLGAVYSNEKTDFKVWAPLASKVALNLYSEGSGDNKIKTVEMTKGSQGIFAITESGDLDKKYYTYSVTNNGETFEVVDPYARSAGVNGNRGMIIDLAKTNPEGWNNQTINRANKFNESIIYETHIREFTIDSSSGVSDANKGKFLGLTETGTVNAAGLSTGIDHLKELGITDLHILPMYDYNSVNEADTVTAQFNWGYDPQNYNVPEGSYSSDATKGEIRVSELKKMIMTLHNNGIRVIMDVVYNHTALTNDSNFNRLVPGYYYRQTSNGSFSNGSGCGNETASERAMFRKFMKDSVVYWASEYKLDGFRFDLMGLHDIETMNQIRAELNKIDSKILMYGEGWTGGASPLPANKSAVKTNASKMPGISVFSDNIRDAVKGGVFDGTSAGFVQGINTSTEGVKFGVVGAVDHPQVVSSPAWAGSPSQSINYVSAHDNNTLWDKINLSQPDASKEDKIKMNKLAASIVLTSHGIPFFTAGEEILRTKPLPDGSGVSHNSYNLPDSTNSIKWNEKTDYKEVFDYYKGLIKLRKSFDFFKLDTASDVQSKIYFLPNMEDGVISYVLETTSNGKDYKAYFIFNNNKTAKTVEIKNGTYDVYLSNYSISGDPIGEKFIGSSVSVDAIGAKILVSVTDAQAETNKSGCGSVMETSTMLATFACLLGLSVVTLFLFKSKNKKNI